ncbi:MAG: cell envelope integrity protein TolA [Sulfurifustis sp.]
MRRNARPAPGRYRAIAYALLLHVGIVAVLVLGLRWSGSPSVAPEQAIQAVIVEDPEKKKLEEKRRRDEEAERRLEAERKRQEAEKQKRIAEEQKRLAEEQKRQQAEAEKRRQADAKRRQEEERRAHEEEQRQRAAAETERKRQEAEARKRREDDERERRAAEESLRQQLAEEERARAASARAARAASELDKYKVLIQQKVTRNWTAVGTSPGLECQVRVRLSPGGDVLQATVTKGSGNPVFDRSVPPAVYKASPLPIPKDPDLFEYYRELDFIFKPQ